MKGLSPRLVIVLPCYNEEEVLPYTDAAMRDLLDSLVASGTISPQSHLLYADDGSSDSTWELIRSLSETNHYACGISLAANSGQQNCVMAGIEYALPLADVIITIDADLQDDITVIPEMLRLYGKGYDVVYGVRDNRDSDTFFKRRSAQMYYHTLRGLGVKSVDNHAGFRLLSSRAASDLLKYDERNLYLRGIIPMLGYSQTQVTYRRNPRRAGVTKYPLKKMINLALDGITSFSVRPVRMVSGAGLIFLAIAVIMLIYVLARYFTGATIEGWTSLMLSVWFCSGVILLALGIVGEYIGKIYTEVKHRPRYSVCDTILPERKSRNKNNNQL